MAVVDNLARYLLEDRTATRVALISGAGETFSRGQLRAATGALAEAFSADGLSKARVGLDLSPTFGAIAAYLALLWTGNTVVVARRIDQPPWPAYLDSAALDALIRPAGSRLEGSAFGQDVSYAVPVLAPVTVADTADPFEPGDDPVPVADPSARAESARTLGDGRFDHELPDPVPSDAAAVNLFTSGTTGRPKIVEISHAAWIHSTDAILDVLPLGPSTRTALILSLAHSFGLSVLHTHLRAGGSLHCVERPEFTGDVLRALSSGGCNSLAGVPTQLRAITAALRRQPGGEREPGRESDGQPSGEREGDGDHHRERDGQRAQEREPGRGRAVDLVMQAGGRLEVADATELLEVVSPQCQLFQMFGQTEAAARISILDARDRAARPGSVGKPIRGLAVRIVDEAGEELPNGELGEVVASGTTLMSGYFDNPEATSEVLRDGWLHTGDFGYLDDEGFLYVTGRRANFVKIDGERISLEAIEYAAVTGNPAVSDALASPIPQPETSDPAVRLSLVLAAPLDDAAFGALRKTLRAQVRATLGKKAVPTQIDVVDEIPHTPNGKKIRTIFRN